MSEYRLYFVDSDNRIFRGKTLNFRNDEDAIREATRNADSTGVELWSGARLVARLAPLSRCA